MTPEEFKDVVARVRAAHPLWFELAADAPASEASIGEAELQLQTPFPPDYRGFLKTFGGGYFGFANVFSALERSRWNVVDRNREAAMDSSRFLAVSSNGTGDFYGYAVKDRIAAGALVFCDRSDGNRFHPTPYRDLYEFLVAQGLKSRTGGE